MYINHYISGYRGQEIALYCDYKKLFLLYAYSKIYWCMFVPKITGKKYEKIRGQNN